MSTTCVICNRSTTSEQPMYCNSCFVFIPQIEDGVYVGQSKFKCFSCDNVLIGASLSSCPHCSVKFTVDQPPISINDVNEEVNREKNRKALALQLLGDQDMQSQIIGMLGLDNLSAVEQSVALTALSKEKMHNLSSEYNFTEAHTLIDMGYALSKEINEEWALNITTQRLAMFYLRSGKPELSLQFLTDLHRNFTDNSSIGRFRLLEIKASLALTHRLLGNSYLAEILITDVYDEVESIFLKMQPEIDSYISNDNIRSEFQGAAGDTVSYPRVDLLANILIVLIDEAMVQGRKGKTAMSDEVLNRMLEFDNMMDILTKMTPKDDTGYFASYLRDYIRIFVSLYWYGDLLIHNDDVKRIVLLERTYDIVKQWLHIIPTEFWQPLRPSKIMEIFMRVGKWHDVIDPDYIPMFFREHTSEYHLAYFLFSIADAKANLGEFDAAKDLLLDIQKLDEVEDHIRELAERKLWAIRLESNGILSGVKLEKRNSLPIQVHIQPVIDLKQTSQNGLDTTTLNFREHKLIQDGFGLFGEMLMDKVKNVYQSINQVGNTYYNDFSWDYGAFLNSMFIMDPSEYKISGYRMEYIVIQSMIRGNRIDLLFEGKTQQIDVKNRELHIHPSSLLILRSIIYPDELELHELVELFVMIMTDDEEIRDLTTIHVLKSKD